VRLLTDEVRMPPAGLIVAESPTAVTITDERGRARTFHPIGREDVLAVGDLPLPVIAHWDNGRLVVLYEVDSGRQVRYTYSINDAPRQLIVDAQFVERGGGDSVRRVYAPAGEHEPLAAEAAPAEPSKPREGFPAERPAAGQNAPAGPPVATEPDAALRGLKLLGLVIEDLTPQAASCGLTQDRLENAVADALTAAGFTVRRNSDEASYVYVNVITSSLPGGLCVSRYDVSITTHATATLTYQSRAVPVEATLLRKGGMSGGAAATHGEAVQRAVLQYLAQFIDRVKAAEK
jgi:hypothetical protein